MISEWILLHFSRNHSSLLGGLYDDKYEYEYFVQGTCSYNSASLTHTDCSVLVQCTEYSTILHCNVPPVLVCTLSL